MEAQDQNKTYSSGTGSHGVHVCHKCNWSYPNAHPSAKQRRAHKKICGKLVLSAVADEHQSDEDHKSPTVESPSVVENTSSSRTVTEHGAFSTRWNDEVFSDASNHFSETSFGGRGRVGTANKSGILVDKVDVKHLSPAQSFKECSDTDLVEEPKSTIDLSQIPPLTQNLPQSETTCQDLVLNSSDTSSGMRTCDKTGPESDVTHIDSERQKCMSDESEKYTVENMKRYSAGENDEVTLEKHPDDDDIILDEHVDRTLETAMEFERRTETNMDILVGEGSIRLKHEYKNGETTPSMPIGEVVEKEAHQKRDEEIVSDSGLENVLAVTCEPAETMQECKNVKSSPSMPIGEVVEKEAHQKRDEEIVSDSGLENVMAVMCELAATTQECAGESASDLSTSEAFEKEAHCKGDKEVISDSSLENVMDLTSVHSETRRDHTGESASRMLISEVVEKEALHKGENEIAVTSEYAGESDSSMPTNEVTVEEAHHKGDKIVSESGLQNVMEVTSEHADLRKEDGGGSASRIRTYESIQEKAPRNGDNKIFPGSMLENVMIVSGEHSEKKSEVPLKSKKRKEMTLVIENAGETVQSEEERRKISVASKTANSVLTPAEFVEYETDIVDTVCEKLDVAAQAEVANDRKNEGDESAHVLAVPTDVSAIKNVETMLEGFKDHKRMKFQRSSFMCSGEELKGEMHEMEDLPKETAVIPDEIKDLSPEEAANSSQSTELSGKGNLGDSTIQNNEGLYKGDERERGQETYVLADSLQDINCSEKEMTDHINLDSDDHERSLRNIHEVALSDNHERVREENYVTSSVVPSESATDLSRTEAGDHVRGKTDEGDEIGSEEPTVGDLSGGMEGKDDEHAEISTNSQTMNLVRVNDCEDEGSHVETKTSVDPLKKESLDSHTETDLHAHILPIADESPNKNFFEFDDSFVKHQLDSSATEFSVESGSQADSLEANPGSISVLSNLSDIPAATDTGVIKPANLQPSPEVEGAKLKNQEAASWVHQSEEFEPPSFMTLVEPGASNQKSATSKIHTPEAPQQLDSTPLRAGWFPSITSAPNESPGRKKNEEIIAKVTNWNMNQEHTPLKSLLGKAASAQAKASSPNRKENQPLLAREALFDEPGTAEAAKEWNSPARYPADIKRERRKAKGRPYWAQFVCCSSVH